jgi:hypothetical protein
MGKTQYEILTELRHRLGQSETTEHLIDWVLDLWETRDFLIKHLGREYTSTLLGAVESSCADLCLHDLVVCQPTPQDLDRSSLN